MNHLINEKSPYLLQHKENPVEWYPWSNEAFDRAQNENKPVFLSIGYSTCHWCHVMAHESFMDQQVADLMNKTFINIKVDREERPDLDQIYMNVCQMLNGSGGWPLNIIMTWDKKPFFAATYISKQGISGRYGMLELIGALQNSWPKESPQYIERGNLIVNELMKLDHHKSANKSNANIDTSIFIRAFQLFQNNFDSENGGFGYRPKFPSPHILLFLMRYYARNKNEETALAMAEKTLVEMRKGGIFDQIGYGFHRYSTDERWFIPHFEKMLYDQAMQLMAYSTAYMITGHSLYKVISEEIIDYVIREMQSPEGGYYSAQDADSEGKEGKFYLWEYNEIKRLLDKEEFILFSKMYPVKTGGNFFEEATGKSTGTNILFIENINELLEYSLNIDKREKINNIHQKLLKVRSDRIAPSKDDKILTNWNGLMIGAMAMASAAISNDAALGSSLKSAAFISTKLLNQNLSFHRYREDETTIDANLEDYAFHIFGLLQLYHTCADIKLLKTAIDLTDKMISEFYNNIHGGFYFISEKIYLDENLITRPQDFYDSALPSGNSVALYDLILLKKYTGSVKWDKEIEMTIQAFRSRSKDNPGGHSFFLLALDLHINPGMEIIINGNQDDINIKAAMDIIKSIYYPGLVYHVRTPDNYSLMGNVAPFTKNMGDPARLAFFICENYSCRKPVDNLSEFLKTISELKER